VAIQIKSQNLGKRVFGGAFKNDENALHLKKTQYKSFAQKNAR
jgi:hypothetical protein